MSTEAATLFECLNRAVRHTLSHKVALLLETDQPAAALEHRFDMVRSEVLTAAAQIQKIREIAEREGYEDILAIFNESCAIESGGHTPAKQ